MGKRTMRGETAIIGIGETTDYKRGRSPDPEFKLVIEAILKAWTDAGIEPEEIDGFASYSNDRNNPSRSRRRDPRRARRACQSRLSGGRRRRLRSPDVGEVDAEALHHRLTGEGHGAVQLLRLGTGLRGRSRRCL